MKTFKIAGIEMKNRYVLAPLAGFTDYSMRKLCYDYGASLAYTEMESCESLYYGSKETIKDCTDTRIEEPTEERRLALQIFGGKEDIVLKSIPLFEKYASYDFLDFNCGCPVPKVIRQRSGSYWLKREDELIALLKEMVKISSKPVIVKTRIGYESIMDMVPLCRKIQDCGVQAIAIHGRTRNEFFSGSVHNDVIKDIRKNIDIPVIANGAISSENFMDVLNQTDADAIMIGQKAIGYPRIFKDLIDIEEGRGIQPHTVTDQLNDLQRHIDLIFDNKDARQAAGQMRGISVKYLKGFDNAAAYRAALVSCKTREDYNNILAKMQNEQR